MTYLKQIFLASLVLSFVVLTAGVAAAEVGIPFGLKWGDSPETVEKTCKKLFGEYTKEENTNAIWLKISSEVSLMNYELRITFFFTTDKKLISIGAVTQKKLEKENSLRNFSYFVEKYFIDPFDSLPEYRKVRSTSYETVYVTPNSRITVVFGPMNKEADKSAKSYFLAVTWDRLNVEKFFIE